MTRPPFPEVIDASLIHDWRSCRRRTELKYFNHWRPKGDSVHLVAGKAFASGIEAARETFYVQGRGAEEALLDGLQALWLEYGGFECPEDSPKGPLRMGAALEFYFSIWPLGADNATPHLFKSGRRGIEFSFLEPFPVNHPVTGQPLLYSGRADMYADAYGGRMLFDEKTASQLGKSWLESWDLRSQFTGYCWGMRAHGQKPNGIVVRGVSILKESFGHAQAITYRADWEVDRWLAQTARDVQAMVRCWDEGYFDYNLDHACTEFGGCTFRRICKSPDPASWLPLYFERKKWDPVTRTETLLTSE